MAFGPPAALALEKQERLCLTANHPSCATYVASLAARETRLAPIGEHPIRWRLARTTSVIEDPSGIRAVLIGFVFDRGRWPAIPAVILVATLVTLAVSGFRPGLGGAPTDRPGTSASQPTSSPSPEPTSSPSPEPTSSPSPEPTSTPTAAPSQTAAPSPTYRTYRVKSGDTLSVIASRFGTTVRAIADLNGIADPSRLRVGQVLLIPW